jgi:hypothetical protein
MNYPYVLRYPKKAKEYESIRLQIATNSGVLLRRRKEE